MKIIMIAAMVLLSVNMRINSQDLSGNLYSAELMYNIPMITSIVWDSDGRMFFTEKSGAIRMVSAAGKLQEPPLVTLDVRQQNEDGVLSMALDPQFADNGYFYVYYTPAPNEDGLKFNVVERLTVKDGKAVDPITLWRLPNLSPLHQHHGGRLIVDPEGYLYVSIGDMSHWNVRSQEVDQVEGKIHRFAIVGDQLKIPQDNPFPNSSVWAYGLRNVYSFLVDPVTRDLLATNNGPDCDDGILSVSAGDNFGWGLIPMSGDDKTYCSNPNRLKGAKPALVSYTTPTIAPTGIALYEGDLFPEFKGHLLFCGYKPAQLFHVPLNADHDGFAGDIQTVNVDQNMGCSIELAIGPDGLIYFTNAVGMYRLLPM